MDSKLLLCCIHHSSDPDQATNETLHKIFGAFGRILDIYIFSRSDPVKAFVKYELHESAVRATTELNNSRTDLGTLRVFLSDKSVIIRRARDESQSADSEELMSAKDRQSHPYQVRVSPGSLPASGEVSVNPLSPSPRSAQQASPISAAKPLQGRALDSHALPALKRNNHLGYQTKDTATSGQKISFCSVETSTPADSKLSPAPAAHSKVLSVSNLNLSVLRPKFLANLFGCFGNVTTVQIAPSTASAVVEFQLASQTEIAARSLDGISLFGNALKVKPASNEAWVWKDDATKDSEVQLFQNDPKAFRYTSDHSIRVNELSPLLHITGVPEVLTPLLLFRLLSQVHEPVKLAQLRRNSKGFRMYLVQYATVEQSVEVLAVMHNKQVNEKFVKLSFSHSKFD